jgi:glycosyltransferase involved in cell wall biosynthesis
LPFAPKPAAAARSGTPIRTVHQFHSGSAPHDAITNALFLIRGLLRDLGYASEIHVEHRHPALARECRLFDELPSHADYVLIVHHSLGYDVYDHIVALPAAKVLLYHNITPPALLAAHPRVQANAVLGRVQLADLRHHTLAALADSDYNALELRALGFNPVRTCTLLFDPDALLARAARQAPTRGGAVFTILFVGRIAQSKGQDALVAAFAAFRARHPGPSRLVLVGGHADDHDPYLQALAAGIRAAGLIADVLLTGLIGDDERDAWYAAADLYVSLSHHEGFGVPLVEAMAHGVPVLAWPSGAIPYTLGEAGELLDSRDPEAVGARIAALAADPARRAAIAAAQRAGLDRFGLAANLAVLQQALLLAGAAPPPAPPDPALERHLRFTIAGHLNGSYSLAAINRRLALVLEDAAPGSVRLDQIEAGAPVRDLSQVPPAQVGALAVLAERPGWETGPHVVVSQHYPVHVPAESGDALLAYVFWEESAIPPETIATLNRHFRGVLAPSAYVAKTLVDNGVSVPVRLVGYAPEAPAAAARDGGADVFTFLHVSSCFPRKGVDVLLRAYAAAFRRGDAVRLVIKGFPNPHNAAAAHVAALRDRDPDVAPIEVIDADLDAAGLAALYAGADAMVLPTRGEGFNLPAAEALALGLPLIVTGHGGHMDFCSPADARLIDYRLAPSASHVASGVSVWAEPDADDLAEAMRAARDDPAAAAERARAGRRTIAARSDPVAWARHVRRTALDLLVRPPDPPLRIAFVTSWGVRCGIAEYSRDLIEALPTETGAITVLADDRLAPDAPAHPRAAVRVAWRLHDDRFAVLHTALAAADPHAVVIQHQPGLLDWPHLAALLGAPVLAGRVVTVTLHNFRHLGTIAPGDRARVVAALAGVGRVIVHTIADLNGLKALGLVDNVVLIPHGMARPPAGPAPRALPADAAPVIGCTGFFLPGKGIPQLIEAAAGLRDRWPGLRLRLVNAEYGHPDSAAEIAAARDVAARTGMAGAIDWHTDFLSPDHARGLLAGCDLIALPYQASLEAASGALRTALAAGVPVLTTNLPLFDEAGAAVLRAPGTDPAALQAGLAEALADAAARGEALEAARAWADRLSWPRIGERMLGMLAGLRASDADRRAWRGEGQPDA